MVGDYAALVSLNFMIDQIQQSALQFKPRLEHLQQKITSLQVYLENHTQEKSQDIQGLERRISHVCHDAEDAIESHILDQILQKPGYDMKKSWSVLSDDLQKVVEELDSITGKAMKNMDAKVNESQQPRNSIPGDPSRSAPCTENKMVGFDKHLIQVMDQITNQESKLQILSIVGMGGIGKSTLARNVYENKLVVERFQIRLWGTISQSYDVQDILVSFLNDLGIVDNIILEQVSSVNKTIQEIINDLGLKLYQALYGRTYLIVVDDIWSIEAWDMVRKFFPSLCDGSRIILTTRLSSLASHIRPSKSYKLECLDKDESWELLKQKVFAADKCPPILEDIGRDIAISCRGLPLAIVVIAGQLAKSDMTKESWKHVAGALSSIVNSGEDGYVLKTLSLSFDDLPIHQKPCFLYMGVFREDSEVCISSLVKLWLAEGFLKPGRANSSLEDNAMEYLTDLVERNLIFVSKRGSSGKMKSCRIHDLLRDVCLRESQRHKFLCGSRFGGPQSSHGIETKILYASRSTSLTISDLKLTSDLNVASTEKVPPLLRSRCLTLSANWEMLASLSPLATLSMFWSLQTFILSEMPGTQPIILPCQIWEMTLLRHLQIQRVVLPDPPHSEAYVSEEGPCTLKNLQSLLDVQNFKLSEEVVKRIPNIKKLKLTYWEAIEGLEWPFYRLDNLGQLCKLETLSCSLHKKISAQHICFPQSLKKLTLDGGEIPWEDMKIIGSLPNIEVLQLLNDAFVGTEWIPIEGEFCQLKLLHLQNMSLEKWEAEKNHFPKLETLILNDVWGIEELPLDIGDIATLTLISLEFCSSSLVESARQLQQEQESMGNYDIQVREDRTSKAIEQVLKLEEYLQQSKDILDGLIKGQRKDENLEKFLRQVQDKVYEAEDFIDTFVTRAVEIKFMNHFQKFMYKVVENVNFLSITKQVKEMCSMLLAGHNYESKLEFALLNGGHEGNHNIYMKAPIVKHNYENIVGFKDEEDALFIYIIGDRLKLDVISIVGMPGLGKTTLAREIFHNLDFEFPLRIWIDISQDFSVRNVFLAIIEKFRTVNDDLRDKTDQELAQIANDHLKEEKFLIVMDDVWTVEDWDKLKIALPISNPMGRVLITSRYRKVGEYANQEIPPYELRFFTPEESWLHLQCEVFGKPATPPELVDFGRRVAQACRALPLAISLVGGILAGDVSVTEDMETLKNKWEKVYQDVELLSIEDSKNFIENIISLSYDGLPYDLRACLLYLGLFPEDFEIPAWNLTRMWIAEGFIPERDGSSLEQTSENYLDALITRKLLSVYKWSRDGEVRTCRIHDTVRDFCKSKSQYEKENFLDEIETSSERTFNLPATHVKLCRRLCSHSNIMNFISSKPYGPPVRSFISVPNIEINLSAEIISAVPAAFGLLRVLEVKSIRFDGIPNNMYHLIHLRYLAISFNLAVLPPDFSKLRNIETLIVDTTQKTLDIRADIWKMTHLRHLVTNVITTLPEPEKGGLVGEKFQTLGIISPKSCTDAVFKKIRCVKKLGVGGQLAMLIDRESGSCDSMMRLSNLEKLKLINSEDPLPGLPLSFQFPPKLKSLTLVNTFLDWANMSVLGQLENLKVLKLKDRAFVGKIWEVADGFCKLEVLYIERTYLCIWMASEHHFPSLITLELRNCEELQEVPIALAAIPSFQTLKLRFNCDEYLPYLSLVSSANRIKKEKDHMQKGQATKSSRFNLSLSKRTRFANPVWIGPNLVRVKAEIHPADFDPLVRIGYGPNPRI